MKFKLDQLMIEKIFRVLNCRSLFYVSSDKKLLYENKPLDERQKTLNR